LWLLLVSYSQFFSTFAKLTNILRNIIKMKSIYIQLVFILCIFGFQLKAQTENYRLAPNVKEWLIQKPGYMKSKAIVYRSNNIVYLSAIVLVNNSLNEEKLQNLGVLVGTKAGNIWTIRIPQDKMLEFTEIAGIDYMELDKPIRPTMDSVRYFTGIDSINQGIGVPILSGKNTVVGIIDLGFDFTHPCFYDTGYSRFRIRRIWDMESSGTPPAGYNYGSELKDSASILQKLHSISIMDHGTQVSSVAAGSGYGSLKNKQFRGVAYESDLVLVDPNIVPTEIKSFSATKLIDGINYIFSYAQSVGKPAVINISLGSWTGPHDGTSLFAQACNNLSGPGRILVFSAGNDGLSRMHLQKTFSSIDTTISAIVSHEDRYTDVEVWGEKGKSYCLQMGLISKGVKTVKTQRICIDNSFKNLFLIGSDMDTSFFTVGSEINPFNQKPRLVVRSWHKSKDSVYFTVSGTQGTAHIFTDVDFAGFDNWATDGDSRYTSTEISSCTSCLSIAAYATKNSWKSLQNQTVTIPKEVVNSRGNIALFSSIGPTLDGRMKPDITAPGSVMGAASNSYSPEFRPGGGYYFCSVTKYTSLKNNRIYYYSMVQGTSFAAPVVTGSVALLLQVNPWLNPTKIKEILFKTAIKDKFTTQNPDSTRWGAGKLNLYAAVKEAILTAGTVDVPKTEDVVIVYPNPSQGLFSVSFESEKSGLFLIEISNLGGQLVNQKPWEIRQGKNVLTIDLSFLGKGIYSMAITGKGGQITKRIIIK
jgi:minor extracellular serine protease Vpr